MNRLTAALILFAILFGLIFIVDYLFIKRRYLKRLNSKKKKKKKNKELMELSYLIGKFKLDKDALPLNKVLLMVSLINAFIIAFVAIVVLILNVHLIIQLIVGFILLLALIYSIYELYGRYLVKKGYGKNGL